MQIFREGKTTYIPARKQLHRYCVTVSSEVNISESVFLTSKLNVSQCNFSGKHGHLQQTDVCMASL